MIRSTTTRPSSIFRSCNWCSLTPTRTPWSTWMIWSRICCSRSRVCGLLLRWASLAAVIFVDYFVVWSPTRSWSSSSSLESAASRPGGPSRSDILHSFSNKDACFQQGRLLSTRTPGLTDGHRRLYMRWGGLGHRAATGHNFPEGLSLATVGGRPRAFRVFSLFFFSLSSLLF